MTMQIPLHLHGIPTGFYATVDAADYPTISQYTWRLSTVTTAGGFVHRYARRTGNTKIGEPSVVLMHRQLKGFPDQDVDHHDGDGLNCRQINLREASHGQNKMNARKQAKSRTGNPVSCTMKGVTFNKKWKKYVAHIGVNGEQLYLGARDTELEAHQLYVAASVKHHGEFARAA